MAKIIFTNKVDSLENPAPIINKVVAADMNEIKTSVNALYDAAPPYKVYTALLNQLGTNAPVATVLQNAVGNIVWTRQEAGFYIATLNAAFPINKVYIQGMASEYTGTNIGLFTLGLGDALVKGYYGIYRLNDNALMMEIYNNIWDSVDLFNLIGTTTLCIPEIRVYN